MSKLYPHAPEFSHPIAADRIPVAGMEVALEAREKERRALAERFGLLDLAQLQAVLTVQHAASDQAVEVTGRLIADVVQACVVTLEPLPVHLEKDIRTLFVAPDKLDNDDENMEPLTQNSVDLGELLAQHLATALDPYPRKPGLPFVEAEYGDAAKPENPFARLVQKKGE